MQKIDFSQSEEPAVLCSLEAGRSNVVMRQKSIVATARTSRSLTSSREAAMSCKVPLRRGVIGLCRFRSQSVTNVAHHDSLANRIEAPAAEALEALLSTVTRHVRLAKAACRLQSAGW